MVLSTKGLEVQVLRVEGWGLVNEGLLLSDYFWGLRVEGSELRVKVCGLWLVDCGLRLEA